MASELSCKALPAHEYIRTMPGAGEAFGIDAIEDDKNEVFRMYALDNAFLLPGGLVAGQQGVVIRDCIIRDTQIGSLLALISGGAAEVKVDYFQLDGEFVSLMGPWSNGFWHWMMEFLPKALIAEIFGFQGRYIMPPKVPPYMTESMHLIGVPLNRLVMLDADACVQIKRLYMPQRFQVDHGKTYLSILKLLRERLLKNTSKSTDQPGRIYISRKHASNGRRVVNELELMELLDDFGFQCLYMEQKTVEEQIRVMAKANWLVGPSGAGMFHSVVMPQSSFVIELFSPYYINPCMTSAMELLHHNYYMLPSAHIGEYHYGRDIDAPVHLIRMTLRNHLHHERSYEKNRAVSSLNLPGNDNGLASEISLRNRG